MLSVAVARLVEVYFTNILLGFHLITFFESLRIQLAKTRRRSRSPNWLLVAVTLVMGIIGMLNTSMDLALNIQVFVVTNGNVSLFTDLTYWMNIVEDMDLIVQPIIGDAMLIYRLWAIYGRKWKITVPFILIWLAASSMTFVIIDLSVKSSVSNGFNVSLFTPFIAAALVLTVVNNIMITSLIVYRMWTATRAAQAHVVGRHRMSLVIRIVVESGLLYTATALVFLGTTVSKSNVDYIVGGALVQVTGIAFNLIIIRITHGLAMGSATESSSNPSTFALETIRTSQLDRISAARNVRPVQVHISQNTETNDDKSIMVK